MDVPDKPLVRLIVHLRNGGERQVTIDFWRPELLAAQLREFDRRRGAGYPRRPEDLHTFNNSRGEVLSFADERYVRHEVVPLGDGKVERGE